MDDTRKRRWLRFSLRTLFVLVTLFCVWLGYSLNWIRQRRQELVWARSHGQVFLDGISKNCYTPKGQAIELVDNPAPWQIRILGERGVWVIYIQTPSKPDAEFVQHVQSIKRLFPEARVHKMNKSDA